MSIKEWCGVVTFVVFLIVSCIVMSNKSDRLMRECIEEGALTKLECKSLVHEMVWG